MTLRYRVINHPRTDLANIQIHIIIHVIIFISIFDQIK